MTTPTFTKEQLEFPDCMVLLGFAGLIFGGSTQASVCALLAGVALSVMAGVLRMKP